MSDFLVKNFWPELAVVLVEPKLDLNVGAVARAMKNFNLGRLFLVAPSCDPLSDKSRALSCGADDILEAARVFNNLEEALAGFKLVVGTTARLGKYCRPVFTPAQTAGKIAELGTRVPVAIMFGREDFGLGREQRRHSHMLSSIPVNPEFSSLNLAQSVLLYGYELSRLEAQPGRSESAVAALAAHTELQGMYAHLRRTLSAAGFLDRSNPDHLLEYLRRLFGRAAMTSREVRIIRGLMSLIDNLLRRGAGL
ncbi:MAG TPA: RNA methyltransferase [Proteobacteria bacterium]|nr:RNA methyltransferase [Pseudomonadota bacterium]